jgi:hypothetical protein
MADATMKQDPYSYRHPRTLDQAFGNQDPIERPLEPSLLRWWTDVLAALTIVGFCIIVVRAFL